MGYGEEVAGEQSNQAILHEFLFRTFHTCNRRSSLHCIRHNESFFARSIVGCVQYRQD